jgi:transposase
VNWQMRSCTEASSTQSRRATPGGCSKEADLKPHLIRYWLTPAADEPDEQRDDKIADVCGVYRDAPARVFAGERVISTDEMTGVQALERAAPGLPLRPGKVERREFEYIRHGTLCLMANLQVATGRILAPSIGPTRSEQDFALHVEQTVATDPTARWLFVVDNLTTHCSESLVRWVAKLEGFEGNLGKKRGSGILENVETRRAFLVDVSHRVRFVYTPKHCSWLNQIECWFSILVRRALRRGSFSSTEALAKRIREFIDYFNRLLAKPFRWTYSGRPLVM